MRTTKDPEVRRNELMDAAERLFIEKGYEHTSASDIIKKAGVAQGTFYYYFSSKDDILNAVIDRYTTRYVELVRGIADDPALDALQKLQGTVDNLFSMKDRKSKLSGSLGLDGKVARHERFQGYISTTISTLITKVVRQGIREGSFEVAHPEETAELVVLILRHLATNVRKVEDGKKRTIKAKAAADLIEKALGAPGGSLRIKL